MGVIWKYRIPIFVISVLFIFSTVGQRMVLAEDMVLIPKGTFIMGSSDEDILWAAKQFHSESLDWYRDETPLHEVTLPDFKIDKFPVTVSDYEIYRDAKRKPAPREHDNGRFNHPRQPIVGLSWKEARDYCHWAKNVCLLRKNGKRLQEEQMEDTIPGVTNPMRSMQI